MKQIWELSALREFGHMMTSRCRPSLLMQNENWSEEQHSRGRAARINSWFMREVDLICNETKNTTRVITIPYYPGGSKASSHCHFLFERVKVGRATTAKNIKSSHFWETQFSHLSQTNSNSFFELILVCIIYKKEFRQFAGRCQRRLLRPEFVDLNHISLVDFSKKISDHFSEKLSIAQENMEISKPCKRSFTVMTMNVSAPRHYELDRYLIPLK